METSKHFKLYKSGKKWCVMAITAMAISVGLMTTTANADANTDSSTATVNTHAQSSSNEVTLKNDQSDAVAASTNQTQATSAVATESSDNQAANSNSTTVSVDSEVQSDNASSSSSVQIASFAATPTYTVEASQPVTPQGTEKNGWVKENNKWTYYTNGEVASGRSYSYLPTINGTGNNWYLVDNGVVQSGVQQWAGSYYDFDSTTYLRVDNDYRQSQWGSWYLFGNDGRVQSGVQKWAGTYYYFDPTTYLRVDNDYRQSQWGSWYLFGNDGRILSGVQQWAGTYYYFDPTTYLRVDNDYRQSQWGSWYLFGNDGRILSGLQSWAGNLYYFNPVTYLKETNTDITIAGIRLHANNDGGISGANENATFLLSIHSAALDGWRQYGVLPSVTAAQAILESAWGKSALATQGHNLFGIKGSYNGQSITMRTAEYGAGGYYYVNAAFRRYPSNYESVVDHGRFLATNSRYNNLLWKKNYSTVTNLLHADGYATDPSYASSLNKVIQTYSLDEWDREVI